jgi:hypothetical protein
VTNNGLRRGVGPRREERRKNWPPPELEAEERAEREAERRKNRPPHALESHKGRSRALAWLLVAVVVAAMVAAIVGARAAEAEEWTIGMALPVETEAPVAPLTPADIDRADIVCRSAGQTDVVATLRAPLEAVITIKRDFAPGVWTCVGTVRTGADQVFSSLSEPVTFTAGAPPVVPPPVAGVRGRPRAPMLTASKA